MHAASTTMTTTTTRTTTVRIRLSKGISVATGDLKANPLKSHCINSSSYHNDSHNTPNAMITPNVLHPNTEPSL